MNGFAQLQFSVVYGPANTVTFNNIPLGCLFYIFILTTRIVWENIITTSTVYKYCVYFIFWAWRGIHWFLHGTRCTCFFVVFWIGNRVAIINFTDYDFRYRSGFHFPCSLKMTTKKKQILIYQNIRFDRILLGIVLRSLLPYTIYPTRPTCHLRQCLPPPPGGKTRGLTMEKSIVNWNTFKPPCKRF